MYIPQVIEYSDYLRVELEINETSLTLGCIYRLGIHCN